MSNMQLAFSYISTFNNFSSWYILFDKARVENGIQFFLMATFMPVSWSFEEIYIGKAIKIQVLQWLNLFYYQRHPYQQAVNQNIYLILDILLVEVIVSLPCSNFKGSTTDRELTNHHHHHIIYYKMTEFKSWK
jgi:hypothetical protein